MGEYATTLDGRSIKTGTCESQYYLRADQLSQLASADIMGALDKVRYRFPFPDEDSIAPGEFEDYDRRMRIDGLRPPAELAESHYSVQFLNDHGYNLSVQCPESVPDDGYSMGVTLPNGVKVHRNGFKGSVFLSQQVLNDGQLVPVLECACGMAWRLRTLEDCQPLLDSLEAMHRSYCDSVHPADGNGGWTEATQDYGVPTGYSTIAERIRQGFDPEYVTGLLPGKSHCPVCRDPEGVRCCEFGRDR